MANRTPVVMNYGKFSAWLGVLSIPMVILAFSLGILFAPSDADAPLGGVMGINAPVTIGIMIIGAVMGIAAIVFGIMQKRIAPSRIATAGIVCGIVGIATILIFGIPSLIGFVEY